MKTSILLMMSTLLLFISCTFGASGVSQKSLTQAASISEEIQQQNEGKISCFADGSVGEGDGYYEKYCDKKDIPELIDITSLSNGTGNNDGVYFINIPVFSSEKNTQLMRDTLQKEIDIFLSDTSLSSPENIKKELHGDFKIYTTHGTTSVVFELYKYLGGANGENFVRTFTFDNSGEVVRLDDFTENIPAFKNLIREKLESDQRVFSEINLNKKIDELMQESKFFINEDMLILVFDQYEIAAGSSGNIFISLELPEIAALPNLSDTSVKQPEESKQENIQEQAVENSNIKKIALTFDDGPSKIQTPRLLEILKAYDVPATFYVLGKNASYFPDIIQQIHANGHEIGNHSWSHAQLTRLSEEGIKAEMQQTDAAVQEAIGIIPPSFRPPYGAVDKTVLQIHNRPAIMWNVDTLDWKNRDVQKNISAAVTPTKDGSIILFHDIHTESVSAIGDVIEQLQEKGFTFVKISELLEYGNNTIEGQKICYGAFNCK